MTRFIKITGILLGLIALLIVISIILLVTFVSPNRFKPLISEQVRKYTGRELTIDGNLTWSFFPYLGVTAGHMSLSNPPEFTKKIFAEFDSATLGVKLFPLIHGRVESSGIALQGMKLNIIKKADGTTNWVFEKHVSPEEVPTLRKNYSAGSLGFAVSSIDITDAEVFWTDEQKNQDITIKNFNFNAKNIQLTRPVSMKTEFDFSGKNPTLSGHASLTTLLAFNIDKQIFSLREINLDVQTERNNKKIRANVSGDLVADLIEQTLQWANLKARVANLDLTGKINVTQLSTTPKTTGHFDIQPFDLKTFLNNVGQDNDQLQVAKEVDGSLDFTTSPQNIHATGLIKATEIQAAKIKLNQLNAHIQFENGILKLAPLTANLYEGSLIADSTVQMASIPEITLKGSLTNVQTGPLLKDVGGANQKLTLTGAANVELQVTTKGSDSDSIVKNLNGTGKMSLSKGTVEGADIGYYIDIASALTRRESPMATNTNKTSFGNLTATLVIQNGILTNNDLLLDSPRFDTKGKGTIDLLSRNIDYSLQAQVKESQLNTIKNFSGMMIPIRITGNLNNPSIRLDTETLMKTVASDQLQKRKDQIREKVQEKIQEKLPGQAGELLKNLLGN